MAVTALKTNSIIKICFFKIIGKEDWGEKCSNGLLQSPINLDADAPIIHQYPSLVFTNYSEPIINAKIRNTGHSSKFIYYILFYFVLDYKWTTLVSKKHLF